MKTPLLDTNPLLESMRRAYHNSPAYLKLNGIAEPVVEKSANANDLPLGVAIDTLEQELADRANP